MKKEIAEQVLVSMENVTKQLDDTVRLIMDNSEQKEFEEYRRALGKIMGHVFVEIMTPLFEEHPQLTPKGLRK